MELITPLSVKISQLFCLGFYSFEISDKSRSGVLFFEVQIAQKFRALRARFCRFALTNAKITQKIGRFAPPGLFFFGLFAPKISRGPIFLKILPNVCFRGTVEGGLLITTQWYLRIRKCRLYDEYKEHMKAKTHFTSTSHS